jgi:hypothetical protein
MEDFPNFIDFWNLTTRVGLKERYAKRFQVLPQWKKVELYNKALSARPKQHPETYLNIGK